MSKKLIAGAGVVASLAVALAPLATFAEPTYSAAGWTSDEHTDAWEVTVLPSCAFGDANESVDGIAHDGGASTTGATNTSGTNASTWTSTDTSNLGRIPDEANGNLANADKGTDTAAYTIYGGTVDSNMGTTTLTVVCTNAAGYRITVDAADLSATIGGESVSIPVASTYSASASGYNITVANDDTTGATLTNVTSTNTTTAVELDGAASANDGDSYTFTYGIGVQSGQPAGVYTGNVVYKLYQQIATESGD